MAVGCQIKCQGLQPASPLVGLAILVLATCQEELFLLESILSGAIYMLECTCLGHYDVDRDQGEESGPTATLVGDCSHGRVEALCATSAVSRCPAQCGFWFFMVLFVDEYVGLFHRTSLNHCMSNHSDAI